MYFINYYFFLIFFFLLKALLKKNIPASIIELSVTYDADLIDKIKTINGRSFDGLTCVWSFPLSEAINLQNILNDFENVTTEFVKSMPNFQKKAVYKPIQSF